MDRLKKDLKNYASEIGIDLIGFASADPFFDLEGPLNQAKKAGWNSGFEHPVIEERVYPDLIFDKPQSLISIGLAYPSQPKNRPKKEKGQSRAYFARASWGVDYHYLVGEKLSLLIEFLKEKYPTASYKSMVDTGQLSDVAVAKRAGLGFIGRNGLLINKKYGSWLYLGEIITDLKLEPDPQVDYDCGDCYRCVQACPGQALMADGQMNAKKCLSYQTQNRSDYMPDEYRRKIKSVIYGCDICQLSCPYNQGVDFHNHSEMEAIDDVHFPKIKDFLTLSNRQFKKIYSKVAGAWRGKKPLQRNAIIALANYRDKSALPLLIEIMEEDPRPMIRGTAAWAISQIQVEHNQALVDCLENQIQKEDEQETIDEMQKALEHLKNKRQGRNGGDQ